MFFAVWAFFTLAALSRHVPGPISPWPGKAGCVHRVRLSVMTSVTINGACWAAFILAAIVAVPLGVAMGAPRKVEAIRSPSVSFCRFLRPRLHSLLILWAGLGGCKSCW